MLNSHISRRLRGRNFLFQVWSNTVGPGARCWTGNRYTPIRRHTFRLRCKYRLSRWGLDKQGFDYVLAALVPGGPVRTVGTYSSSWVRPSKVRLLIMSRATSG